MLLAVASGAFAGPEASCVSVITPGGAGSGTVIARKGAEALVLTNRHVVDGVEVVWVMVAGPDGVKAKHEARVLAINPGTNTDGTADVALVVADIPNPAVRLATSDPQPGDIVRHYGHATGPQKGRVDVVEVYTATDNPFILSRMFSVAGDSGAGVFVDGRYAGIHHAARPWVRGAPDKAISDPVSVIRPFLKRYAREWGDW